MPRPDYEKFKSYCFSHKTFFSLICNEINPQYGYMFAKLCNPNTSIYEENGNKFDIDMGVHIDLFIYDGMGDTFQAAKRAYKKSSLRREILVAANWKHFFKSKTHPLYYEPVRFLLFLISRPFKFTNLINRIESMYQACDFYSSKYVGNLCSGIRSRSVIERSIFDYYVELEFEGERFKVFKGYEFYLKNTYGDYMKLPPLEKRTTHHTFKAYLNEN